MKYFTKLKYFHISTNDTMLWPISAHKTVYMHTHTETHAHFYIIYIYMNAVKTKKQKKNFSLSSFLFLPSHQIYRRENMLKKYIYI